MRRRRCRRTATFKAKHARSDLPGKNTTIYDYMFYASFIYMSVYMAKLVSNNNTSLELKYRHHNLYRIQTNNLQKKTARSVKFFELLLVN